MSGPKKIGRPSLCTPDVTDAICRELAEGRSLRSICGDPGMPSHASVTTWLSDPTKSGFLARYQRARADQADTLAEQILDLADERPPVDDAGRVDPGWVAAQRMRVEARKWYAGKVRPKAWGDRISQEITGPDGGPLQVRHSLEEEHARILELQRKLGIIDIGAGILAPPK